jgi:ABC-type transport system involved in multi-copper enzyme maturation permease subunit
MRWGPGPVFIYDCLANSRRWQTYAIRSSGVAALLVAMTTIAVSQGATLKRNSWREYAQLGEYYFYAMIGVELALVMLAAPAAAAGAICLDRARGTLAHMLATDLSDSEIVLGKLAARLMPVLGLVACSWPVLAISALLGGIDPWALTMAFAVILAVALLGCTMALTLSVWARKPHEVVLVTYTVWIIDLLIWPIWYGISTGGSIGPPPPWTFVANPYCLAFAPYAVPGRIDFWDYLGFFAVAIGMSVVLSAISVWRMRPVACRGTNDDRKGAGLGRLGRLIRWLPGPGLDNNPVLWREWHRSRPSPWMMGLVVLLGLTTFLACVLGAVSVWAGGIKSGRPQVGVGIGVFGSMLQVVFGLLMLSAVAPMSMSEERQRGSLDILATTILSSRAIVFGKWLGTYRLVPLLTIGPGLLALALATAHKDPPKVIPGLSPIYFTEVSLNERILGVVLFVATILVHGALIGSVGLALATWIKRQSRAISISVCGFVFVAIGWPILVEVTRRHDNRGLISLSPVMAVGMLADLLAIRTIQFRSLLSWITFWDVEVTGLAIGLLWLTVRTFDRCFGRIPERPRQTPLLADFVLVLDGMVAVAGLSGAIAFWIKGLNAPDRGLEMAAVVGTALMATVGYLLVSALAAVSISGEGSRSVLQADAAGHVSARELVLRKSWGSFRLVLLMAIGPALIALAMTTTYKNILPFAKIANLPDGTRITTSQDSTGTVSVTTIEPSGRQVVRPSTREEVTALSAPEPWEPTLLGRLLLAVLAVLTVLIHGALATSAGLVRGLWIRRRYRAVATCVGLILLVVIGYTFFISLVQVFLHLGMRMELLSDVLSFVEVWDAIMILATLGLLWLSIRAVDRGLRDRDQGDGANKALTREEMPTRDPILVGE